MRKEIAFIIPYPIGLAPSQRFRFEQYSNFLEESYKLSFFPFLTKNDFKLLYQPRKYFYKSWIIVKGFLKRLILMFQLRGYSIVFIHREASPIGPPIFEWIIHKILKKKIIYDFDDAIWLKNTSTSNRLISTIKRHSKVSSICKWSSLVMCGNHFLMDYAKKYTKNVIYLPTTIDTVNVHNQVKNQVEGITTIGWTGTHSTIKYLYDIESLLVKLQNQINFRFVVISNKDPFFKDLKYEYKSWIKETEINDLLQFDIGIMPLLNDEWANGKCGFKALQYMSLGIPCVISPVGVNIKIIQNGFNGFLVENENEWKGKLTALIKSKELRTTIGLAGKETVLNNYSVKSTKNLYLTCFNQVING
ncbi:MAG: glycosyltransferase [Flavobacteriales bacterium]|nr:glycosyltransferase [Flavobacteriales bacterium]